MTEQISSAATAVPASAPKPERIRRGSPAFWRVNLAMFSAGFSTFSLIYCVQSLMPVFSREFGVSPAQSSLALSATTGTLAVAMLVASSFSEIVGRKPVMVASLTASSLLMLACAFTSDWYHLVMLRALAGLAFSGLPAVAMAYLSEELDSSAVGLGMGLYIGGSAIGGLSGRAIAGIMADIASWRGGLLVVGGTALICALLLWRALPASRNFQRTSPSPRLLLARFAGHLRDGQQRILFLQGFLLLGSFVCVYNYAGYRLMAAPFELSQTRVSFVFAIYIVGIFSSAYLGDLGGRIGRGPVLCLSLLMMLAGLLLTLAPWLPVILLGMTILTFGFFGAHSNASSWVGAKATVGKAQAASLYLFCYYIGSSIIGTLGGLFWSAFGWPGIVMLLAVLLSTALAFAWRLTRSVAAAA